MATITATLLSAGVPVNGLVDTPEITIIRLDTGAAVITADTMTDSGVIGNYRYDFSPLPGISYSVLIDSDPSVTGQTDIRYFDACLDSNLFEVWNDRGLDPTDPKAITENTLGEDYDEDTSVIHKDVVKSGSTTTITRT